MKKTIAVLIALAGAFAATLPLMAETETAQLLRLQHRM